MVIEISVAVIAVAFVVLVIYLIGMTKDLRSTLTQANRSLKNLQEEFDGMGGQAKQALKNINEVAGLAKHSLENINDMGGQAKHALEHANQISFDLKQKLGSLASLFNAVAQVGEMVEHKISAFKNESLASPHEESHVSNIDAATTEQESHVHEPIKIADILELAGIGIRLWQKLKKRR